MEQLIGNRVDRVTLSDDATIIEFSCPNGRYTYVAEGDCCSESWFNHLSGVGVLLGQTVREVIQRDEPAIVAGTRQEEDRVYGWTLVTDRGHVDLEMRNSSNGYYGGWASYTHVSDEPLSGRVVTEDF